jgi:ATP-dependent Lhr-like helicase
MKALESRREGLGDTLRRPFALQSDGTEVRWWTFAGGKINRTLKYALEVSEGWKVVPDNFAVRISGPGASDGAVRTAVSRMARTDFWASPSTQEALLARLPAYRLSKFQDALPDEFAVEMVGSYLLDMEATRQFIALTEQNSPAQSAHTRTPHP